ncbi:unnamed protein product [Mytilus edulis]|uniref:Fork-head domain-containing protein n=1 Tax=Mytilus edulis TaxID=6550 RepID=A0A8S3TIS2_MYTED|nr:unnamed protein product [Mytilus edulis]
MKRSASKRRNPKSLRSHCSVFIHKGLFSGSDEVLLSMAIAILYKIQIRIAIAIDSKTSSDKIPIRIAIAIDSKTSSDKIPIRIAIAIDSQTSSLSISQQKRKRSSSPCLDNKRQKQERLPKPPYSYTGMIVLAIDNQPDKTITTSVLFDFLRTLFPFFCTAYTGWKHTVRKTLSINRCFECIDRIHHGGKVWTVVFAKVPRDVFLLQKNNIVDSGSWAPTLYQHLNLKEIALPANNICTESIPHSSMSECSFSAITTSSATVTEPSSHSVIPDFNFSIDSMFTNINQSQVQEETDDFRRADCFDSSPLNLFSIPPPQLHINRRPKPSKITKTKKYKELEQMINNHASNLFVSPDIAVSNLRLLCDSVTSIFQEEHHVIPEQHNSVSFDMPPFLYLQQLKHQC